jgi:hypothetical protein
MERERIDAADWGYRPNLMWGHNVGHDMTGI